MKSKLLAIALTLGVSQAAIAHSTNYNGWAVGASVGWIGSSLKVSTPLMTTTQKLNFNHTAFGVHADWYKTNSNNLLMGYGFGVGYHSGNPSKTVQETSTVNVQMKQQRKFYAEVVGRLGWNLGNSALYALAAIKGTQIENKTQQLNTNNFANKNKFVWGIAPGVGGDVKINKNWSMGAEYRYFFEKSGNIASAAPALQINVKQMRSHNLRARVSYHF